MLKKIFLWLCLIALIVISIVLSVITDNENKDLKNQVSQYEQSEKENEDKILEVVQNLSIREREIEELKENINSLNQSVEKIEEEKNVLIADYELNISLKDNEIETLKLQIVEFKENQEIVSELENQILILTQEKEDLTNQYETKVTNLQNTLSKKLAEIRNLEDDLDRKNLELANNQEQLDRLISLNQKYELMLDYFKNNQSCEILFVNDNLIFISSSKLTENTGLWVLNNNGFNQLMNLGYCYDTINVDSMEISSSLENVNYLITYDTYNGTCTYTEIENKGELYHYKSEEVDVDNHLKVTDIYSTLSKETVDKCMDITPYIDEDYKDFYILINSYDIRDKGEGTFDSQIIYFMQLVEITDENVVNDINENLVVDEDSGIASSITNLTMVLNGEELLLNSELNPGFFVAFGLAPLSMFELGEEYNPNNYDLSNMYYLMIMGEMGEYLDLQSLTIKSVEFANGHTYEF